MELRVMLLAGLVTFVGCILLGHWARHRGSTWLMVLAVSLGLWLLYVGDMLLWSCSLFCIGQVSDHNIYYSKGVNL